MYANFERLLLNVSFYYISYGKDLAKIENTDIKR